MVESTSVESCKGLNRFYRLHLMHNYKEELCKTAPILKNQKDREPGSFWIRKK